MRSTLFGIIAGGGSTPATDPVLVGHGDSMMWGSGDENTDPNTENPSVLTLALLSGTWVHTNVGYPGAKYAHANGSPDDLLEGGTLTADPLYDATALHNILITNGGINNIPFVPGPISIETNYPWLLQFLKTAYIEYGLARRAVGWGNGLGHIVSPMPVCDFPNTPSDYETYIRTPFNTWLAANFWQFAAEYADWTGNANIGDGADTSNATYFDVSDPDSGGTVDRLHLTAAGYAIEAQYFADAIERMIGDGTPPAAPTGLNVTSPNCEQISVAYVASAGDNIHHYEIRLNGGTFTNEVIDIGRDNPYIVKNLAGSTEYSVEIRTVDVGGTPSSWTASDSATTAAGTFERLRAIDCGRTTGGTVAGWEQDADYTGATTAYAFTAPEPARTFLVDDPAPTVVYETARIDAGFPNTITYTFADVDPAKHHRIRMHFIDGNNARTANPTAGSWKFDIDINGSSVKNDYDLAMEIGAGSVVGIVEYQVAAGATDIEVVITKVGTNAQIAAIELFGVAYTPPPPPPPSKVDIGRNTGGEVSEWYDETVADFSITNGTSYNQATGSVDTTGETNPAPEAVYRNVRYELGTGIITAVVSGLTPSTSYTFRTHHWTSSGHIAGTLTFKGSAQGVEKFNEAMNFDANGVYIKEFTATSDGAGEVTLEFSKVVTGAVVNGIEWAAV